VYVDEKRLLPGGDCDRSDKIVADPSRVAAAMKSFGGLSNSIGGDGKEPNVTQACMRPCAPDAMPILGPVDGISNAYMATAHNCWGILWSPVTGEIISQLITRGRNRHRHSTVFADAVHGARKQRARAQDARRIRR
jgi:glycine/D-amino acid oxidase-like deaminating enzyme